jgi:acetylornithine aminotransferase
MNAQNWIDRGQDAVVNTYARYPLVVDSGAGCWLTDYDGNRYLDFLAGVAVNNLGHCHPAVVAALQEQAAKLIHCSNFYHVPNQIELAELLCEHSFGDRVFFCNSGAEANETAIKLARKHSSENYATERTEIITATHSFHGRTLGTLSATGQEKVQTGFAPILPGFRYVPFGDADALRQKIGPRTCAVLLEPVQGEGGVQVPPAGYLKAVRQLCDDHNLLLILDEIQVGIGRTGTLFAYQQEEIEPDLMTLAKALAGGAPIGAMVAREPYAASLAPGSHGSTFGGNPLVTAAGIATLKTLLQGDILAHCQAVGNYLRQGLERLQKKYSLISEVRGRGLMLGMELTCNGSGIVTAALERGLLINCTMGNTLRFLPPLIVTQEEIDRMLEILTEIFSAIKTGDQS